MITDVTPAYLLAVLKPEDALKVWRHLQGTRVYFPKCRLEHDEIRTMYKDMKMKNSQKIKVLAEMFEKSEDQIRKITRTQGSLFG